MPDRIRYEQDLHNSKMHAKVVIWQRGGAGETAPWQEGSGAQQPMAPPRHPRPGNCTAARLPACRRYLRYLRAGSRPRPPRPRHARAVLCPSRSRVGSLAGGGESGRPGRLCRCRRGAGRAVHGGGPGRAGASVTVLEARDRVGGRVLSASPQQSQAAGQSLVLDLGAQWVGPGQTEILRLIRELRLHVVPTLVPGRSVWALNGQVRQGGPALPPMPPRALADLLVGGARLALMSRAVWPDAPWRARRAAEWDQLTAGDWIRRHVRTPEVRAYAEALIRVDGAMEPGETSLLNLLFDYRSVGSARNLARAEMFRLREGAHELARRLSERIRDRIRLAQPVRAVIQDAAASRSSPMTAGCAAAG